MTSRTAPTAIRFAIGEGIRNALASRLMGGLLVVISAAGFTGVATADAVWVAQLAADESAWVAAGGNVLVVSNEDGLSGLDCDRLNSAAGVRAAVGLSRPMLRASLSNAPDAGLTVVAATAGLRRFLGQPVDLEGAIVSREVAADYGLADHGWTKLSLSAIQGLDPATAARPPDAVDGVRRLSVADLTLLGEEYATGVILADRVGEDAQTCMVWAEPGSRGALRDALPGVLPGSGSKPTVVDDRLFSGAFSRDYEAEYQNRPWQWAPLPAGAAIGLIWMLIRWVRRSEDGLYQSLGVGRTVRLGIRLTEWTVYTGLAALTAVSLSMVATLFLTAAPAMVWPHSYRSVLLAAAASLVVSGLAGLLPARNPLDALKDR